MKSGQEAEDPVAEGSAGSKFHTFGYELSWDIMALVVLYKA